MVITLVNLIKYIEEKKKVTRRPTLLFISIFLIYLSAKSFLPIANERTLKNIILMSIILVIIYYYLFSKLFKLYDYIIDFFVYKVAKIKIRQPKITSTIIWFFPSVIFGIGSLLLFGIFIYYISIELSIFGNIENDYRLIAVNISNIIFPILVISSLIIGFCLELYYLIQTKKIEFFPSFISSSIALAVIIVIMLFIKTIINSIVG